MGGFQEFSVLSAKTAQVLHILHTYTIHTFTHIHVHTHIVICMCGTFTIFSCSMYTYIERGDVKVVAFPCKRTCSLILHLYVLLSFACFHYVFPPAVCIWNCMNINCCCPFMFSVPLNTLRCFYWQNSCKRGPDLWSPWTHESCSVYKIVSLIDLLIDMSTCLSTSWGTGDADFLFVVLWLSVYGCTDSDAYKITR